MLRPRENPFLSNQSHIGSCGPCFTNLIYLHNCDLTYTIILCIVWIKWTSIKSGLGQQYKLRELFPCATIDLYIHDVYCCWKWSSFNHTSVIKCDIKNNAWVTVNNDFLVTSEGICQWFSRMTKSRVKITGKSPHEWPKNRYSR